MRKAICMSPEQHLGSEVSLRTQNSDHSCGHIKTCAISVGSRILRSVRCALQISDSRNKLRVWEESSESSNILNL